MQLWAYRVNADQIKYVQNDEQVQKYCQTPYKHHQKGCPNYGNNWSCPPYAPLLEKPKHLSLLIHIYGSL